MTWQEASDDAKGWLSTIERDALHDHAITVAKLGALVEVGGYCGKSAIALGAVARDAGTVLFSVDWHRGSPEMAVGRECHHPEMMTDGLFDSLPHFRRNVQRAGLEAWVVPVVGASPLVGRYWQIPIGLLFIDGAHDEVGVNADFDLWAHHVVDGGILAFHDVTIPCIGAVAQRAETSGFEFVETADTLRVLRRKC
jgi:predicted O-methyltransferase YrrM